MQETVRNSTLENTEGYLCFVSSPSKRDAHEDLDLYP